jgi:alkylation response protein AidB-like acyl-CoA dehydrogenase
VNVDYPTSAETFRHHLRALFAERLPAGWQGLGALPEHERAAFVRGWRAVLAKEGLLAASWPETYGGAGLSAVEQVIVAEELARAGAPDGTENDGFGIRLLGNTLIAHGTPAQKQYFLPRILSGEHAWCQGYSEPDAGSDLAGLRTRAVLNGDHWVINGQKTWTSAAGTANWIFAVVRTNSSAAKHKGLSFLLVPLDQPGVEVRPIRNAAGYAGFDEVFFSDARTRADNIVGAVDGGWPIAMALLGFERGVEVTTDAIRYGRDLDLLIELARVRGALADPRLRDAIAWCHARILVMRSRGYVALTAFLAGESPGAGGAVSKVIWSEYFQRYTEVALEILGLEAVAPEGTGNGGALTVPDAGTPNSPRRWVEEYLYARAATIYGGSAQIQRTVIGEQLLGLPREPRLDAGPFEQISRIGRS